MTLTAESIEPVCPDPDNDPVPGRAESRQRGDPADAPHACGCGTSTGAST